MDKKTYAKRKALRLIPFNPDGTPHTEGNRVVRLRNIYLPEKTLLDIWTEQSELSFKCGRTSKEQLNRSRANHLRLYEMWGRRSDERDQKLIDNYDAEIKKRK